MGNQAFRSVWWAEPKSSEKVQAIQDRWRAAMHLIVKANADGDPAADGQNPEPSSRALWLKSSFKRSRP
ncbi:MAG: hypothetical protein EBS88_09515 [Betaproteobacteria bacterium]|nr:hypothetical protein [Betaproteobacteria bacterium]